MIVSKDQLFIHYCPHTLCKFSLNRGIKNTSIRLLRGANIGMTKYLSHDFDWKTFVQKQHTTGAPTIV